MPLLADPDDIRTIGDDLLSLRVDAVFAAQAIAANLRAQGGWREAVVGIESVVAQFDNATIDIETAIKRFAAAIRKRAPAPAAATAAVEIPVIYGGEHGPDLDSVCATLGLGAAEFIERHTAAEYRVDMLGFTPGFAYLSGLDSSLDVPRRAEPRQFVPAGSLGIAGARSGLYALPGPGGWSIVGRTAARLFDATAEDPFALAVGTRVRFAAIDSPS